MNADLTAIIMGILSLGIYAGFRVYLIAARRKQRAAIRAAYERKDGELHD